MFLRREKRAIVAGYGKLGKQIANELLQMNYKVIVIDNDAQKLRTHVNDQEIQYVVGDASDTVLLEKLGICEVNSFIAVSNSDTLNSMLAQIASSIYKVEVVYARLYDRRNGFLLEDLPVQIICPFQLSFQEFQRLQSEYQHIENMSLCY